jgi:plasmid stability protein
MANIQIRNVSPELHRALKVRAAEEGVTLSEYLRRIAEREVGRPSNAEIIARLRELEPVDLGDLPTRVVRELRDAAG